MLGDGSTFAHLHCYNKRYLSVTLVFEKGSAKGVMRAFGDARGAANVKELLLIGWAHMSYHK